MKVHYINSGINKVKFVYTLQLMKSLLELNTESSGGDNEMPIHHQSSAKAKPDKANCWTICIQKLQKFRCSSTEWRNTPLSELICISVTQFNTKKRGAGCVSKSDILQ